MAEELPDISATLAKWMEARQKLEEYTKRVEKYRKLVEQFMLDSSVSSLPFVDKISGLSMKVTMTMMSRETLSKNDVPSDIWDKYCKASRFRTLRISKQKQEEI